MTIRQIGCQERQASCTAPQNLDSALNKRDYCTRQKGVQNSKDKKGIQRRAQGESVLGNHQQQQEHGRGAPRIQPKGIPALALEISVPEECSQSI